MKSIHGEHYGTKIQLSDRGKFFVRACFCLVSTGSVLDRFYCTLYGRPVDATELKLQISTRINTKSMMIMVIIVKKPQAINHPMI